MFWPLALASVLVVMDLVVFCISRRAGAAVSVQTFKTAQPLWIS